MMPNTDQKLMTMDADIKSLQSEVGRLVSSQKEQTAAIGESVVMMGRLCERLDSSIETSKRAHERIDKLDASVRQNSLDIASIKASQPTNYQIVGYVVVGLSIFGGAAKALGLI